MKNDENLKFKLAIIERRRAVREDLARLVDSSPGLTCAGGYATLKNALAGFERDTPDIVLLNKTAQSAASAGIRALREKFPKLPVLILNVCVADDEKFARASETIDCDLTPHETRLLKLLVEGHNYTTAAAHLKISYNTVKFHMRRVYQKLEVNSKSAAVAKAMRYRLVN